VTFGELLAQLLGWLGSFIAWIFDWLPRRKIIDWTDRGVHYPLGKEPRELAPGIVWYVPNRGRVVVHNVNRFVLELEPMALETKEGIGIAIGMTVTARITDILRYEVDNFDSIENMAEQAKSGLREIVNEHTWAQLCAPAGEGTRLEGKLKTRMERALSDFGLEVERCGLTDQVRLRGAHRFFGMTSNPDTNKL
jgi:hypothetical protein